MKHFPEKHTAENIKHTVENVAEKFGIPLTGLKIITDSGANIKKACQGLDSFLCFCHKLSTCIENAWQAATSCDENFSDLNASTNKLVSAINHKLDIQGQLKVKVKDSNQTRAWRGLCQKFERIQINFEIIERLAANEKALRPIFQVDRDILSDLVGFLQAVNAVFDEFEKKTPTSQMVLSRYYKLLDLCVNSKDSIKSFTEPFTQALKTKFYSSIKDIHYLAAIMTPQFRKFLFVKDEELRATERKKAVALLKALCPEKSDVVLIEELSQKKNKVEFDSGEDDEDDFRAESDEAEAYLTLKSPRFENPLDFWKLHKGQFPVLSENAAYIFVVPASSSVCERLFS